MNVRGEFLVETSVPSRHRVGEHTREGALGRESRRAHTSSRSPKLKPSDTRSSPCSTGSGVTLSEAASNGLNCWISVKSSCATHRGTTAVPLGPFCDSRFGSSRDSAPGTPQHASYQTTKKKTGVVVVSASLWVELRMWQVAQAASPWVRISHRMCIHTVLAQQPTTTGWCRTLTSACLGIRYGNELLTTPMVCWSRKTGMLRLELGVCTSPRRVSNQLSNAPDIDP